MINEEAEMRERMLSAAYAMGLGLEQRPLQVYMAKYGSPFVQTPHGPVLRPSLRGL